VQHSIQKKKKKKNYTATLRISKAAEYV